MTPMEKDSVDRQRDAIGCLMAFFGVAVLCALLCGSFLFYYATNSESPPSPQSVFESETGLTWPSSAVIVSSGDDHGGFHGDGEFHVMFEVDDATVNKLLAKKPASPLSDWTKGPVPTEIGCNCLFGTTRVSALSHNGGLTRYSDDPELDDVLGATAIMYSAHERCCDTLEWHNGTLLIVDPRNRRVWLSIWDF